MPSPPSETFALGPLSGHWYGLLVAVGGVVFALLTAWLWQRRGGSFQEAFWLCLASMPFAVVGGRLYHLATGGWSTPGERSVAVWEGGLGIFGAVAAGGLALALLGRWRGLDPWRLLDCAVPGLALAQGIGRLGNWFNQELYGEPTDLPWGLEIDVDHRLPGYLGHAHYHPTFLYELLWDVALAAILLWLVAGRRRVRPGIAVGVWLAGYSLGRLWIEGLRIDPADHLGPLRLNQVVALLGIAAGSALVVWRASRPTA
jgi:prolipoprotein diacylglyceryl transferase